MNSQPRKTATAGKGSGLRRRFRGRTVLPSGSPRSHHVDRKVAPITYTSGDTAIVAVPTSSKKLSPFRVSEPTKSAHRHGFYRGAN